MPRSHAASRRRDKGPKQVFTPTGTSTKSRPTGTTSSRKFTDSITQDSLYDAKGSSQSNRTADDRTRSRSCTRTSRSSPRKSRSMSSLFKSVKSHTASGSFKDTWEPSKGYSNLHQVYDDLSRIKSAYSASEGSAVSWVPNNPAANTGTAVSRLNTALTEFEASDMSDFGSLMPSIYQAQTDLKPSYDARLALIKNRRNAKESAKLASKTARSVTSRQSAPASRSSASASKGFSMTT